MNAVKDGSRMAGDGAADYPRIVLRVCREWWHGWPADAPRMIHGFLGCVWDDVRNVPPIV